MDEQTLFEIIADYKNGYRELIGKDTDFGRAKGKARVAFENSLSISSVKVMRLSIARRTAFTICTENNTLRLFP